MKIEWDDITPLLSKLAFSPYKVEANVTSIKDNAIQYQITFTLDKQSIIISNTLIVPTIRAGKIRVGKIIRYLVKHGVIKRKRGV